MKGMNVLEKTLHLQTWFCSFLVHNSPEEAAYLARKDPMFPREPNLEAFR
jgi:hypothetical protein